MQVWFQAWNVGTDAQALHRMTALLLNYCEGSHETVNCRSHDLHIRCRYSFSVHDIKIPLTPRRPLQVAVVTETYPPEINGVARAIKLMVDGLLSRGHSVNLVRPRQKTDDFDSAMPALPERMRLMLTGGIPIPRYANLQLGLAWPGTLKKAWQEQPPDLVHVVTEGPLGWAAVIAARRLGLPLSSDFHTNFHSYTRHYGIGFMNGVFAAALRLLHNRCDCTMVPTGEMRRDLAALNFQRLAIVGRGIDSELFNPARRSTALRRSWGCTADEPVALCVGRVAVEKNMPLFIRAAKAMRRVDPRVRIVLVGDGPAAAALRAAHTDLIFAGMRVGEDLAAHYASADVFLFPSITETFGNVTIEALASGLAVLAFDYAAAREYITDGKNGVLVPFDDSEVFLTKARWMAQSPGCLPAMRLKARALAERLSWERVFDDLEQVLLAVADRAPELPIGTVITAPRGQS